MSIFPEGVFAPMQDRLVTLEAVREAGISVCAGGIIGLGEGPSDRVGLLHQLATLPTHPESVPINALVAVAGTPLGKEGLETPTGFDMARCIAAARVVMPKAMVRLSAGRLSLTPSDQVSLLQLFWPCPWPTTQPSSPPSRAHPPSSPHPQTPGPFLCR